MNNIRSACYGSNWFAYAQNDPVNLVDQSGCSPLSTLIWSIFGLCSGVAGVLTLLEGSIAVLLSRFSSRVVLVSGAAMLVAWFNLDNHRVGDSGDHANGFALMFTALCGSALMGAFALGRGGIAGEAVSAIAAYVLILGIFMALDAVEDSAYNFYGSQYGGGG